MENLNAEQVIKALEWCIQSESCEYCEYKSAEDIDVCGIRSDALAIIKSQEQTIFELENRLKECENGYEGTLHLERCKLHDAEEKIEELTEDNTRLQRHVNRLKKYDEERDIALHARLIREAKTAAVREVQEKAKAKAFPEDGCGNECIYMTDLEQITKEIAEEI